MKKSAIEIKTDLYINAHGKPPRGRGNWWFEILNRQCYYSDASYGQAVKAARNHMKRLCQKFGVSTPPAIALLP